MSMNAAEVVTPVVKAEPLLCVPSDVSENFNWCNDVSIALYNELSDKSK